MGGNPSHEHELNHGAVAVLGASQNHQTGASGDRPRTLALAGLLSNCRLGICSPRGLCDSIKIWGRGGEFAAQWTCFSATSMAVERGCPQFVRPGPGSSGNRVVELYYPSLELQRTLMSGLCRYPTLFEKKHHDVALAHKRRAWQERWTASDPASCLRVGVPDGDARPD